MFEQYGAAMYLRALFTARPVREALKMGLTLGVSVSFFVSVVNSQVYTVYKYIYIYIYFLCMHIFSTIFALTYTDKWIYFFSTKGAIISEAFSHTFLHDLLKKRRTSLTGLSSLLFSYYSSNCNRSTVIL